MKIALAVFSVLWIQDAAPDPKDPSSYVRAVETMMDWPEGRAAEIEKAVSAWPAFYRDLATCELAERRRLGSAYLPLHRVNVEGEETLQSHVGRICAQSGWRVADKMAHEADSGPIKAARKGVAALRAIADLCAADDQSFFIDNEGRVRISSRGGNVISVFRDLAFDASVKSFSKTHVFAAPPAWDLHVELRVLDPGRHVHAWIPEARVIEAATGKGAPLVSPAAPPAPAIDFGSEPDGEDEGDDDRFHFSTIEFPLRVEKSADVPESVALLRLQLKGLVVTKWAEYSFDMSAPRKIEDATAAVEVIETVDDQAEVRVTLVPKTVDPRWTRMTATAEPQFEIDGSLSQSPFRSSVEGGKIVFRMTWLSIDGKSKLKTVKVRVPATVVERPFFVEIRNLPIPK